MTYTTPEIREDIQWERSSPSWKGLEPRKNFNEFDENDESVFEYCQRVKNIIEVPEEVAAQWLYCHYYNGYTVDNYGWINYFLSVFEKVVITTDQALNLRVIKDYSNYVNSRTKGTPFSDFMCRPEDKEYWIKERTWRTPPVIINVSSFPKPPSYSDVSGTLQLIEGHSRLGYLRAMNRADEPLKKTHFVYMLRNQK